MTRIIPTLLVLLVCCAPHPALAAEPPFITATQTDVDADDVAARRGGAMANNPIAAAGDAGSGTSAAPTAEPADTDADVSAATGRGDDRGAVADEKPPAVSVDALRPLGGVEGTTSVGTPGAAPDHASDGGGSFADALAAPESAGEAPVAELLRVGGALAAVLTLVFILRFIIGRLGGGGGGLSAAGRPSGVLEVLARYPIAKGQHLVLLKLGRRIVLAHQAATAMSTLTEITEPDEVAALLTRIEAGAAGRGGGGLFGRRRGGDHGASDFRSVLGRADGEFEPAERRDGPTPQRRPRGEVVDLTRAPSRGLSTMFNARRNAT